MKKILCFIVIGILLFETYYIYYLTKQNEQMLNHNDECVEQIEVLDSLLLDMTVERDSLLSKINTVKTETIYVKEKYKQEFADVVGQSIDDDMEFFSEYLLSQMHD